MPSINTTGSGHAGPVGVGANFLPYTNAEGRYLSVLQAAMNVINSRIVGHAPCNTAFRALPRGRSFSDVWHDNSVWINYDPDLVPGYFGARFGNDITIAKHAFVMGHWTVVSTLVHELAHVNGAPGGNSRQAEDTLKRCLLHQLHDPTILGRLFNPMNNRRIC